MIELLVIITGICLYASYKHFKSIMAPPVLFCLGFFLCGLSALNYKNEWDLDKLGINTFLVITSGIIAFVIICFLADRRKKQINKKNDDTELSLKTYQLILYLAFLIIYYFLYYRAVQNVTGETDFGDAVKTLDHANKFDETNDMYLPKYITRLGHIVRSMSYIIPYFAASMFILQKNSKRKDKILYLLILTITIIGPIVSGGRGGAIKYLLATTFAFYIAYKEKVGWRSSIPKKMVIYIIVGGCLLTYFWSAIGTLLGRGDIKDKDYNIQYYTAIYCGAQIKNLDIYLNETQQKHSKTFGYNTFIAVHRYFNTTGTKYRMLLDLPFQSHGIYPLGNVYTCFYQYIYDFGYWGLILTLFFAYFVTKLWKKTISARGSDKYFYIAMFGLFVYPLLFSFFSNEFYQTFASPAFVWNIILWKIELYFIKLNNRKKQII